MTAGLMTFDELFALTPAGDGRWTAPATPRTGERVVFGGLVVGQAIMATAYGTRRCHALHGFFIGPGAFETPFDVSVEKMRDGGSFSTRRFEVCQGEHLLMAGYTSHHDGNDGPRHQMRMPDVPPPEHMESLDTVVTRRAEQLGKPVRRYLASELLQMRRMDVMPGSEKTGIVESALWFRAHSPIQGPAVLHQAAIGFASDVGLVHAGMLQQPNSYGQLQAASLDHSLWFHREAPADQWLLQLTRCTVMREGRGLSYASIFTPDGQLVASVAQEFLARYIKPAANA